MSNITKEEYKILRQLYNKGSMHIDVETANILIDKKLIDNKEYQAVNPVLRDDEEYVITNEGKTTYENCKQNKKDSCVQIAIAVGTGIAAIVAIIALII